VTSRKRVLLSCVALAALAIAALVSAANLPTKAPLYNQAPVYSWQGFYIGTHSGFGWGQALSEAPFIVETDPDGFFGGLQIGYNWMFLPSWVVGIQADISAADIHGQGTFLGFIPVQSKLSRFGTVLAHFGHTWDQALLYVPGGFAWARQQRSFNAIIFQDSASADHTGWALGVGLEYAIAARWTLMTEYLYQNLGSASYNYVNTIGPVNVNLKVHTFRTGINYRF
jgi:outer membrane immunogenic protein